MSSLGPSDERKVKPIAAKYPWPSIKSLLRTMAALALGYILLLAYLHYQGDPDVRRIFGGSRGMAVLNHADRVEAYRVEMPADRNKWSTAGLDDYPILKGPLPVPRSDVQSLLATLKDHDSYIWNARKGCELVPGARLDFVRGDERLSVLICFECDMIASYLNGRIAGGADTEKCRPDLVRIARSLFADDPKIQSLAERSDIQSQGK